MVTNFIEYLLFLFFVLVARIFSFRSFKYLATPLGLFFYYIIPIRKNVVLNNLRKAFPVKTEKEINKIAKANYIHFINLFFEFLKIKYSSKTEIMDIMEFPDLTKITELHKLGKPFFFLTAHFGNWEIAATAMGIKLNLKINVLAKPQRNKFVSDWLNNTREIFGNKVVLLGASVREIYRAIRENAIVGIVGDQRGSQDGPKVKYFDIPTSVYTGTAAIAVKTNTPILVTLCYKQENSKYTYYMEEIKYDDLTCSNEEKELVITQKYMSILEKYIRKYPEQWFWMHNIWKY